MTEAVFRALLDAILILFRRRSESVLRALPAESTAAAADSVAEALFHEVVEHRRLAHSAGVLFLRGQARQFTLQERHQRLNIDQPGVHALLQPVHMFDNGICFPVIPGINQAANMVGKT